MLEKEYLDRETVIKKLNKIGGCDASDDWDKGFDEAIEVAVKVAEELPAVEVVHCKDCKWYKESKLLAPNKFCFRLKDRKGDGVGYNFAPDDFCSHGERTDGEPDANGNDNKTPET